MSNLHRKTKQEDAEQLAVSLQTCCAYDNSALVEDGICVGSNEFYYRVVEHYIEINQANAENLERVADILETLVIQFRESAGIMRDFDGDRSSHIWSKKEDDTQSDDGIVQI